MASIWQPSAASLEAFRSLVSSSSVPILGSETEEKRDFISCGICLSTFEKLTTSTALTRGYESLPTRTGEPVCTEHVCSSCFHNVVAPTRAFILTKVKERAEIVAKQRAEEAETKARNDIIMPFSRKFP